MARKPAGKATHIRKHADGTISHVQFQGREGMTPMDQAVNMTKEGVTKGVQVNVSKNGREYIQDIPDGSTKDNLLNLPEK